MEDNLEYYVPVAVLNEARGEYAPIECKDATYRIPDDWLKANASRFYFTDEQIIRAAVPEFRAPNLPGYARCFGIYFLIANGRIIYVGESTNLERRLAVHRKNGVPFDSLTWFEAPDLYLKTIEAYYIRRIDPPLNVDKPGHIYFDECINGADPYYINSLGVDSLAALVLRTTTPKPKKKGSPSSRYHQARWLRLAAEAKAKREQEAA